MLLKTRSLGFSSRRNISDFVKIVEVGPRDGLQNEARVVPTETKISFIDRLSATGLKAVEVTGFVSPKWIPQMSDNRLVFEGIKKHPGVSYPVLVPNLKGLEAAMDAGVTEIAVFATASESFSLRNVNCSIAESINRFRSVIEESRKREMKIRGYVSCVVGCPYEGDTDPSVVANLSSTLLSLGCYEISLGDTVGVGTPRKFQKLFRELRGVSGDLKEFALHCHDTYGQAIGNIYCGLENGIRVFDSSVAGLGGCPYADGASGNVATEDLLYLLEGQHMETGVNLQKIVEVGDYISRELDRRNSSKAGIALMAKKRKRAQGGKEKLL